MGGPGGKGVRTLGAREGKGVLHMGVSGRGWGFRTWGEERKKGMGMKGVSHKGGGGMEGSLQMEEGMKGGDFALGGERRIRESTTGGPGRGFSL